MSPTIGSMNVGGQLTYAGYIGNVSRIAVELANAGGFDEPSELSQLMFEEHHVARPVREELGDLPGLVAAALGQIVDRADPVSVKELLDRFPPYIHLSDHEGTDGLHIHAARNGAPPPEWLGRTISLALAHLAAGDPVLTTGRCAARNCGNFFVDDSRNRTRRFCSNACASRTTVAAYRVRAASG